MRLEPAAFIHERQQRAPRALADDREIQPPARPEAPAGSSRNAALLLRDRAPQPDALPVRRHVVRHEPVLIAVTDHAAHRPLMLASAILVGGSTGTANEALRATATVT